MFSNLAHKGIAAPGMAFRTGIADLVGGYDSDNYLYLEDWPLFLKLTRKGILPVFINKYIVYHSMGGVTHKNIVNSLKIRKKFIEEKYYLLQHEVDPYIDYLLPKDLKQYHHYMKYWMDRIYIMECHYYSCSYKQKLKMMFKDFRVIGWVLESKLKKLKTNYKKATDNWSEISVLGFVAFVSSMIGEHYGGGILVQTLSFIAMFFAFASIAVVLSRLLLDCCLFLKKLIFRYFLER